MGADDHRPLGLMGSGDFVAPQYSIDSLNLYDYLEGTTSHRSNVNQFQLQVYKTAEKGGGTTLDSGLKLHDSVSG